MTEKPESIVVATAANVEDHWCREAAMLDVKNLVDRDADEATVIYAIGDIHGRADLLDRIEVIIAEDIAYHRPAHPLICYLGDYIDRGPESAQVIDRLCGPFHDNVPRFFLKGNHEDRMIDFLREPKPNGPSWIKFGGREALESYGVDVPEPLEDHHWSELRDALANALPATHHSFLSTLRLGLMWRAYLLVHAGLNPDKSVHEQSPRDLMWIREPFLSSDRNWGFTVVHGHVISDEPIFRNNRIGIDTGAYQSERLTCLVIAENGTRVLQTTPS